MRVKKRIPFKNKKPQTSIINRHLNKMVFKPEKKTAEKKVGQTAFQKYSSPPPPGVAVAEFR